VIFLSDTVEAVDIAGVLNSYFILFFFVFFFLRRATTVIIRGIAASAFQGLTNALEVSK
jgi:hypothetical protein